jgi:hypothetical protein
MEKKNRAQREREKEKEKERERESDVEPRAFTGLLHHQACPSHHACDADPY